RRRARDRALQRLRDGQSRAKPPHHRARGGALRRRDRRQRARTLGQRRHARRRPRRSRRWVRARRPRAHGRGCAGVVQRAPQTADGTHRVQPAAARRAATPARRRVMDFVYPPEVETFRAEVRDWLGRHLVGEYLALGTGAELEESDWPVRVAWEKEMGRGGWIGLSWPKAFGGREASAMDSLVFAEEYARAGGPTRAGTFGEGMLGPTLIHFGTEEQKDRFLPPILRGEEIWCQAFSEPGAGSDLAGVSTRARRDGDRWVLDGQKVWTSQAHLSQWIFVLARTDPEVPKHKGISFFLVPLDQPGIDIRPLRDIAGGEHFCEVFFDGALTDADLIVGAPGAGWRIAIATLSFERGTAFIGQLKRYAAEFDRLVAFAAAQGRNGDSVIRQRLANAYIGL